MQRNTGYFPTESLEPSGNRLFSRSALNEGDLFRGSLDYFGMIEQYGAGAVAANLKAWLDETSSMGCGDDITVLIAYFMDDGAPESEATASE